MKMIQSSANAIGQLTIVKRNIITNLSETFIVPNIVTTIGKTYIAQRFAGLSVTTSVVPMQWMALGTGTSANNGTLPTIAVGDAVMGYETPKVNYAAVGGGSSLTTRPTITSSTSASNVVTYVCTFPAFLTAGAIVTQSLTEAGIFNGDGATTSTGSGAGYAGTMLCHTAFAPVNKTWADAITITWNISLS